MNYYSIFSAKNKKNISKCLMLKILSSMLNVIMISRCSMRAQQYVGRFRLSSAFFILTNYRLERRL